MLYTLGLFINNKTACINSKLLDCLHQIGKQPENTDDPRATFFDTLKALISLSPPAIAFIDFIGEDTNCKEWIFPYSNEKNNYQNYAVPKEKKINQGLFLACPGSADYKKKKK